MWKLSHLPSQASSPKGFRPHISLWKTRPLRGSFVENSHLPHAFHITFTFFLSKSWKTCHSNLPLMELFRSRMISPMSGSVLMRDSTRFTEEMTVE